MLSLKALLICSIIATIPVLAEPDDVITTSDGKTKGKIDPSLRDLQAYRSLFAAKRREQIETADKILGLPDYAKQYKMIEILCDTLFPEMNKSMTKILAAGFVAGLSPFPEDNDLRQVIGVILEGIPLFGDVLLRLPNITKEVYKRHRRSWKPILKWSMEFCQNTTAVFNGHHATQLHLIRQEIGFIPEDPDYVNPFRKKQMKQEDHKSKKTKKKPKSKKGPKLRTSTKFDL